MSKKDNGYHFSPTARNWVQCPAKIKCTLDNAEHITEAQYKQHLDSKAQEATLLGTSLGHAQIGYIYSKTRLDAAEIRDTLKELRQEGSALTAPQEDEVRAFIEQERFKVTHDPTITAREKREILKNLRQADKDLDKMQVTGGVFHAWKNGMKASLKKVQRPLMAATLVGLVAFTASGCAGSTEAPAKPTKPGVEQTEKPTTEPVMADCEDDGTVYGSVIVDKLEKGPGGEYCSIKIDPNSPALKVNKERVSDEVYAEGYTDADVQKAQTTAVNFVVNQVIDNKAAGDQNSESKYNAEWLEKEASSHYTPDIVVRLKDTMQYPNGVARYTILSDGLAPPIVHDKQARFKSLSLDVSSVNMVTTKAGERKMTVNVSSVVTYRVDATKFDEWTTRVSQDQQTLGGQSVGPFTYDAAKPTYMDLPVKNGLSFTPDSVKEGLMAGSSFDYDYLALKVYN